MKTLIRHSRREAIRMAITTALLIDEENKQVMARGIAICSTRDQFCRKTGRELAIKRAVKAFNTKRHCIDEQIRRPVLVDMLLVPNKCMYRPTISPTERAWVHNSFREKKSNDKQNR